MVKTKLPQTKPRKPGAHVRKPNVSTKKVQPLKQQSHIRSPSASRVEPDPSSSADESSSNGGLNEEQIAQRKVLKQKARKAKNQCRYYQA